jgi:site-specific recombinase XerD
MMLVKAALRKPEVEFTEALDEFLNTKLQLQPKTVSKYSFIIREFKTFVESQELEYVSEFTPDHATKLLLELTKGREVPGTQEVVYSKPKTVNGFLAVIKAFFNDEVLKDHIVKNPMRHINNLKVEKAKPEYYSEEELRLFFSQEMDSAYRLAFRGLLYTGMRFEELASVHWDDVDFEGRLITVRRKDDFSPKTENSERSIPIADALYQDLVKANQDKKSPTFVFTSPKGTKLKERTLLEVCKKIAANAGITSRAFLHKFRHTFATHLVRNRVPLERVQKLLGHASITETLIYAHLIPNDMHDDVRVLNVLN